MPASTVNTDNVGSSPLARGLLHGDWLEPAVLGIIPARAGFTRRGCCWPFSGPDHPRSRGVYWGMRRRTAASWRIIPARAGFTTARRRARASHTDHPRSRGVYVAGRSLRCLTGGSSPLARGLRPGPSGHAPIHRIIPARAGFTSTPSTRPRTSSDHPRSRGVYMSILTSLLNSQGSSPLARGLLRPSRVRQPMRADHPRSRGVYPWTAAEVEAAAGSSPLARGLRYPAAC